MGAVVVFNPFLTSFTSYVSVAVFSGQVRPGGSPCPVAPSRQMGWLVLDRRKCYETMHFQAKVHGFVSLSAIFPEAGKRTRQRHPTWPNIG
jgi:hypothetical protein